MNSYISSPLTWYCWVPTNLGELSFNFITLNQVKKRFTDSAKYSNRFGTKVFFDLDLSFIIDTLDAFLITSRDKDESPFSVISINDNGDDFSGKLSIFYRDSIKIISQYKVYRDGKVKIENLKYKILSNELDFPTDPDDDLFDTFAQISYMIIKNTLHGDNHHHQKIDYVLEVQRENFDACEILKTFGRHIKHVENDIKHISTCTGHLKAKNSAEEVKGYISYAKTFVKLYANDISGNCENQICFLQNISASLNANVTVKNNNHTYLDSFITIFLTFFALLVSSSILIANIYYHYMDIKKETGNDFSSFIYDNIETIAIFLPLIILAVVVFLKKCQISSWMFYRHYKEYEIYKNISWIHPKKANIRILFIKFGIPFIFIGYAIKSFI